MEVLMDKQYKILGISSGRVMGNSEIMLREAMMECEKLGNVDARIIRLRTLKINENPGDYSAMDNLAEGGSGLIDTSDDFEWIKEQILWADAIIFSAPCFVYQPSAEIIILMNRALGLNPDYAAACRANPKKVGMIVVGGSDTVDFHLPMQDYAMEKICPGFELVDQFYADWIRGKGYIAFQDYHMDRARLLAKRMMNSLKGFRTPPVKTRIMKLNPLEYKDDVYVDLEECPVCHSAAVEMENIPFMNGQFSCAICGARGHVEHHGGNLTYVWDDDSIAHNRYTPEHDQAYIDAYKRAHAPVEGPKEDVPEFPFISPANDPEPAKPRILAIVAGPKGGTSELLARKALAAATADGKHEGAILNILERNIHFCTGCLICKVNVRYRGGKDRCILKDEDLWCIEKIKESVGCVVSVDVINGYTYGKFVSCLERFGHGDVTRNPASPNRPKPYVVMISSFDDQVKAATFATRHFTNFYMGKGPFVDEGLFKGVPLKGNNILANREVMGRAGALGNSLIDAVRSMEQNPVLLPMLNRKRGMCPSCKLDLIELHPDMTVSCCLCDAHGVFVHRFGENNIIWDQYSVEHSRTTDAGAMLHFKHINYSQSDDRDVLDNPNIIADELQKYKDYGKIVKPERKKA